MERCSPLKAEQHKNVAGQKEGAGRGRGVRRDRGTRTPIQKFGRASPGRFDTCDRFYVIRTPRKAGDVQRASVALGSKAQFAWNHERSKYTIWAYIGPTSSVRDRALPSAPQTNLILVDDSIQIVSSSVRGTHLRVGEEINSTLTASSGLRPRLYQQLLLATFERPVSFSSVS